MAIALAAGYWGAIDLRTYHRLFDDQAFITATTTGIPIDLELIPLWAGARLN